MAFIHFTTALDWHKEVIAQLKKLVQIEKNKTDFYVYEILVRLSLLWLVMRKHITLPQEQRESIVRLRMQKMESLEFIIIFQYAKGSFYLDRAVHPVLDPSFTQDIFIGFLAFFQKVLR